MNNQEEIKDLVRQVVRDEFGSYLKDISYRLKSLKGDSVPASKLILNIHLLDGYILTNNDPSIGYISWSDLHIMYEGTSYAIDNGNTNKRYVWWDQSFPTVLQCTDEIPSRYKAVVFEDCEDIWNELIDPDVVSEIDSDDKKAGAAAIKLTVGAGAAANDILATEAKVSFDITGYDTVFLWIKSSVALDSGDLQLLLDDTPLCASPIKFLNIPALAADTWVKVGITLGEASGLGAVVSVGIKMVVDKGEFTLRLDEVYAFGEGTLTEDDVMLFLNMDGIHFTLPKTYLIDGSLVIPESIYTSALRTHCVTSEKILANSVLAIHIAVDTLAAINANLGTVTSGLVKSIDEKMQLDLDNNVLTVQDINDYYRFKAGLINGDFGFEVRDSQNDLMISSKETLALSPKYVQKLRNYFISTGYITPTIKEASSEQTTPDIIGAIETGYFEVFDSYPRAGQKITLTGYQLSSVKFYMAKEGSPTGTAYVRVRRVSDDGIIETSATTLDISTLTATPEWKEFVLTSSPNEAVYITFEYTTGGDLNNNVHIFAASDNISGIGVRYFSGFYYEDSLSRDATVQIIFLDGKKENTVDGSTSTFWQPKPVNEAGAWVSWDLGVSKIIGGCQIYWGAAAAYRPTNYKIYTSPDNSAWTERKAETTDPTEGWKEYTWDSISARYVKLIVTTHGATGTRIYEVQANVISPKPFAFVLLTSEPTIAHNTKTLLHFDNVLMDFGSNFDAVNHKFIVPEDGIYAVTLRVLANETAVAASWFKIFPADSYETFMHEPAGYPCMRSTIFRYYQKDDELLCYVHHIYSKNVPISTSATYFVIAKI